MANNSALLPAELDISRKRGDTFTFSIVFNEGCSPKDFTGYTFALVVNTEKLPEDTSTQMFRLESPNITGDDKGNVNITLGTCEASLIPNQYYYDLEAVQTSSGQIRTLATGRWVVLQDIAK